MWSFCGWWGVGCSFYIRFLEIRILYDIYIEYSIGPSWTSTTLDSISLWEPKVWKASSLISGSHPLNLVRRLVNSQKTVKDWWNAALETSQIRFDVIELSKNGIELQRSSNSRSGAGCSFSEWVPQEELWRNTHSALCREALQESTRTRTPISTLWLFFKKLDIEGPHQQPVLNFLVHRKSIVGKLFDQKNIS